MPLGVLVCVGVRVGVWVRVGVIVGVLVGATPGCIATAANATEFVENT